MRRLTQKRPVAHRARKTHNSPRHLRKARAAERRNLTMTAATGVMLCAITVLVACYATPPPTGVGPVPLYSSCAALAAGSYLVAATIYGLWPWADDSGSVCPRKSLALVIIVLLGATLLAVKFPCKQREVKSSTQFVLACGSKLPESNEKFVLTRDDQRPKLLESFDLRSRSLSGGSASCTTHNLTDEDAYNVQEIISVSDASRPITKPDQFRLSIPLIAAHRSFAIDFMNLADRSYSLRPTQSCTMALLSGGKRVACTLHPTAPSRFVLTPHHNGQ